MTKSLSRNVLVAIILSIIASLACSNNNSYVVLVTATPLTIPTSGPIDVEIGQQPSTISAARTPLDPQDAPTPTFIPTPDPTRSGAIDPAEEHYYTVQFGDTLGTIAQRFGISSEELAEANNISNPNLISQGQVIIIPLGIDQISPAFKIIPDSELIYGPALKDFRVEAYLAGSNSFLSRYSEEVEGEMMTGIEIIERVALEQSVSTRLLLALLEYESGWISQSEVNEDAAIFPMNYRERPTRVYGLYEQLDWAAGVLQSGYYGWRLRGISVSLTADGTRVGLNPGINAGTASVQMLLAQTRTYDGWMVATQHTGFFNTYVAMFGNPFQYAVDPLIPPDLTQPPLGFPWPENETWYYTGGPHGGWGPGSAWSALDFVPAGEEQGCTPYENYTAAVADGVIARSEPGIVILDLDGDGFEGTGWTIFYLHLATEGRQVVEGQRVSKGDLIGHPSCEGGVSWSSHLHIGRRYNGEWISADCSACTLTITSPQFVMDGWAVFSYGIEYDGSMMKGDVFKEACTCREDWNALKEGE